MGNMRNSLGFSPRMSKQVDHLAYSLKGLCTVGIVLDLQRNLDLDPYLDQIALILPFLVHLQIDY